MTIIYSSRLKIRQKIKVIDKCKIYSKILVTYNTIFNLQRTIMTSCLLEKKKH